VIVGVIAGQADIDLVKRVFGQNRDAVERFLTVDSDVVAEALERFTGEGVINTLGLLQADQVGRAFGEPSRRSIKPLLD
jgi:hypothetical protein